MWHFGGLLYLFVLFTKAVLMFLSLFYRPARCPTFWGTVPHSDNKKVLKSGMSLILSFCLLCFAMHAISVSLIPKLMSHILGFRAWQVCFTWKWLKKKQKQGILVKGCYLIQLGMDFPRLPIEGNNDPHHHIDHTHISECMHSGSYNLLLSGSS